MTRVPLTPQHELVCSNPAALRLHLSSSRSRVEALTDAAGWAAMRWNKGESTLPVACSPQGEPYSDTDWRILLTLDAPKPPVAAIRRFLKEGGDPCTRYPNAHGPVKGQSMVFAMVGHSDLTAATIARLLGEVGKKTPLASLRQGTLTLMDAALRRPHLDGLLLAQWLKSQGVELGGHPGQLTHTLHQMFKTYFNTCGSAAWIANRVTRSFDWNVQSKEGVFAPLQADLPMGLAWFRQWLAELNAASGLSQPLCLVGKQGQVVFEGPVATWLVSHIEAGMWCGAIGSAFGAQILAHDGVLREVFEHAETLPWDVPSVKEGKPTTLRSCLDQWRSNPPTAQKELLAVWHHWKTRLTERLLQATLPAAPVSPCSARPRL